ncbi:hypothetical protein N431DRAFT_159978 [Stipitochalara longipes BDJ]|nr:hypothetical protein N431DRAFT_159978 [Stipitochalara longipes BDJ]
MPSGCKQGCGLLSMACSPTTFFGLQHLPLSHVSTLSLNLLSSRLSSSGCSFAEPYSKPSSSASSIRATNLNIILSFLAPQTGHSTFHDRQGSALANPDNHSRPETPSLHPHCSIHKPTKTHHDSPYESHGLPFLPLLIQSTRVSLPVVHRASSSAQASDPGCLARPTRGFCAPSLKNASTHSHDGFSIQITVKTARASVSNEERSSHCTSYP